MSFDNFIIIEENLLFWQNMELNMHCAIFRILGDILKFEKVS